MFDSSGRFDASGGVQQAALVANVLIVDDDQGNLMAMQELLQCPERNVVLANSGKEALRCLLRDDFSVILLDARMPGLDGFATAKLIRKRENSRHTPIIFITGAYEDVGSIFRGYAAGAVDYIVKPLVPDVLKSKVSVFVDLYNKNAELIREITERKAAEAQLRASEEKLRAFAARLQSAREEERSRIAREVHDELGQILTALKMDLTALTEGLRKDQRPLVAKAKSMSRLIDGTIRSVRKIASGLRPNVLDEQGLAAAIGWQARQFQMRAGVRCRVKLSLDDVDLGRDRSTAIFRIFQEILTNVARHAKATRVDITMKQQAGTLLLEVQDNGRGISEQEAKSQHALGLLGMRERALLIGGKIDIVGVRGKGTKVTVAVPFSHDLALVRDIAADVPDEIICW